MNDQDKDAFALGQAQQLIAALLAEREKDRAVMRQALEALKYHTQQTRPITATQVAIHELQRALGSALTERVGEV